MASRHDMALAMFGNETSLRQLACALIFAGDQASEEGIPEANDPAVILLSCQIAFVSHADSITHRMLNTVIASCEANKTVPLEPVLDRSH